MAKQYNVEDGMRKLGRNLAIQAETIGPKINGNRHGTDSITLHVFNIYDIDTHCYLKWEQVVELCKTLNLQTVPEVYRGPFLPEYTNMDCLMALADSQKLPNGRACEGIVLKTCDDGPRFSCKVISNAYILSQSKLFDLGQ